ncbi:MAG: prolyl oligopeptidase family serine peptidase [Pseudomonadota bacterium]
MTSPSGNRAAPCGAWPSPISAAVVAAGAAPLSLPALDGADAYWLAGRASEGGRSTIMRQRGQDVIDMTPAPFNVRSRVHEYGGGAFHVAAGVIWFSNHADNRIYVVRDGAAPVALSAPDAPRRHADFVFDSQRQRLIGVREDHAMGSAQPVNTICAIGADGVETVLASGADFYSSPRLSPDCTQLAWMSWDHPRMPWQGTELWLAEVQADGALGPARLVAGGPGEAITQPQWSPAGLLHFVSDRSGWWNLYRLDAGAVRPLYPHAGEFGMPHWSFGEKTYGFRSADEIVCTYIENGVSRLGLLCVGAGQMQAIPNPYQEIRELRVSGSIVVLLGGAPTIALELARIDLYTGEHEILARSITQLPDSAYLSVPESITFPTGAGALAHAFFYPPTNGEVQAETSAKPPLIVIGHGGPTGMATNTLKLATQFWTSRGFAVLDVNYRGSSGFGRDYRDALKGQWGVVDVDDCVAGARYLATRGDVDADRLIIRGSSAGGLTTLCALAFHDVFKAGACYYGVSDLAGLDADSHKFESHYNEYLIAPASQAAAVYLQRSPINHSEKLKRPMIFFQGLDDKVVPPQQSEVMVKALRAAGVPVAYMTLEGEGHGFRKSDSIIRTLEAELYFYQRIFGMAQPGGTPPVAIENLPGAA